MPGYKPPSDGERSRASNLPGQAVPADGVAGDGAVGLQEAVRHGTVQARLALLEAPVLLEPVWPARHALGILPVAKAAFLRGLTGHRQPFRHWKREQGEPLREHQPVRPL